MKRQDGGRRGAEREKRTTLKWLLMNDVEQLFMSIVHHASDLGQCLFRSSAHFSIRLVVFLALRCLSSLYILDVNPLSDIALASIFSHSVGCLFVLLTVPFAVQDLFSLM